MRKIIAAATFAMVLGVAGASNPADQSPEARAYMGFSFGGERIEAREFHYGLRLDHDSRFLDGAAPPLMQLDFTRQGLSAARVNGLSVVRQRYQLKQTEEPAADQPAEQPAEAAPAEGEGAEGAEEPGFFKRMWNGITGVFSGGDEEAPAEETAAADAPADAESTADDATEGTFLNYSVVDWGLLAVGAVGLGYAVGEISNGDESDDFGASSPPPPTTAPPPVTAPPVTAPPVTGPPLIPPIIGYASTPAVSEEMRERMEWLDGGTGQMGDLLPREEE